MISSSDLVGWCWGWHPEFPTSNHKTSLISAAAFFLFHIICIVRLGHFLFDAYCTTGKRANNDIKSAPASSSCLTNKAIYYIISCLLLLFAVELPVLLSTPNEGLADLIKGTDPKLNEILDKVPAIQLGPSPPILFRNRHVQFIPWLIQNLLHELNGGIPYQRINVEVSDCLNKMEESCSEHKHRHNKMNDTIALDIFPPLNDDSPYSTNFNKSSPIILFQPGLRCHSNDLPGNSIVRKAFESGFRSIVVNRRGLIQPLKNPRLNIFGDVDDLEQVYHFIKRELVTRDTPFFLHGISAGTAVTVSALSKWDRRRVDHPDRNQDTPVFVASVDVVPGYDISKVMNRERFLWPYNDLLMQGVKDHFVLLNEKVLREHDSDAVDEMLNATNLQELVDAGVVFAGYTNTSSYYAHINPINKLGDITTPKFVLNAADDPCCNIANLYETSPYPDHGGKTFAQMIRETKRGMVAVTYTGSHAPFLCSRDGWLVNDSLTGGWMLNSWADQVAIGYYQAALDVYSDRKFL